MVFADLGHDEKDAFFALLDEYFSSRPDLFKQSSDNSNSSTIPTRSAISAVQSAFSSSHNDSPAVPSWKRATSSNSSPPSNDVGSAAGRVAAAAAALRSSTGMGLAPNQQDRQGSGPPRPPPRRLSSSNSENDSQESISRQTAKLVPQRKFGDVDLSSGKNMFTSLRHSTANKTATPPPVAAPIPPAFPAKKNMFAPPPVRRVPSVSPTPEAASPPPPPPPPPVRHQEEPEGEWAEALYEYSSTDPGDLPLEADERVLIVEKTSDDWWTAEKGGRRGLVPAAYVRLL
ncbi:hypothetical protein ABKN59_000070 [Abortiporus biennis]